MKPMRPKQILYTSHFLRQIKKIPGEEKKLLGKFEKIFRQDCFDCRLKTHKLSGKLDGFWACSVSYKTRILFEVGKDNVVTLNDIGSHDIYK
ncbi:hypothetical protein A3A14_01355 [Candidatus Daviesbacteria bacterium RIFCSPLOWO2_01_FULL_43_38]|uniref:Uncharacterized protein n=3 Tax=Candidatus Daviesiibacteriota TaxID=1752718 RepID=A0A1F5K7V9_9BACT|nr:MAG: hypothetical protein UV33_C0003G0012 [Candidatus Daviesbacteria bacterium GW2011_GWA1_42_6]KKS70271.1 MAG: hypothetical protein UV41_C0030G0003 [Candidatus Daviesbacteria bacterium GW2011_GWA2_42_7]OGE18977.1 MAG: hypothetical protein A2874_02360 [Candidatus Daviesbacteria bacterium RIFCSPHIGHO2_01_FULL_43_17]OGE36878.1 MAG: hypothetical protein A3E45_03480 [Candidatus Daviesbacteria bacterium RIFCSPHIGHO2_12_FULL_43_11]OGE63304.1 MAG: hypothetical protein A3A14_01355 [Candidatus Davies